MLRVMYGHISASTITVLLLTVTTVRLRVSLMAPGLTVVLNASSVSICISMAAVPPTNQLIRRFKPSVFFKKPIPVLGYCAALYLDHLHH